MAEDTKEPKQEVVASDLDDAKEILTGRPYHWKDWCLARGRDCLYVWSDAAALELSNGSNGWFRFILDGKLATMYSSGSPEGGSDSSESRSEFVEKLQRARNQVRPGAPSQPILTAKGPTKLVVGNWSLQCIKEGELIIHNSDGQQQATILKEDLAGFIFESNRGTKHSFTAETSLGPEFSTGWTGKKGKRLRSKAEQVQQKVKSLAHELYQVYFKAAESHPRDVVAKLHQIVEMVEHACDLHNELIKPVEADTSWNGTLKAALLSLSNLLKDENSISAYELHSSGLVQVLLNCLNDGYDHVAQQDRHLKERIGVFKAAFKSSSNDDDDSSSAIVLVRKLIAVLESIEKLPLFLYDAAGAACGLQVLTRRLRFRLERAPGETALIDRTGRTLKMEPLATVSSLERYLQKMVSFQWYDYERTTFAFVKRIKEGPPMVFRHSHDFDENGLIYWVGTNGKTAFEWVNPAAYNLVSVSSSEGKTLPYGRLEDVLSRDPSALNCHTNDDKKSWFSMDLGLWLIPSAYTLRHARGYGRSALRNWIFQVSKDGQSWISLLEHNDDSSLNEPGSTATWPLEPIASEKKGWRYIRIQQNGKNASSQTHYLSLSGFEIYGTVTGVTEEQLTKPLKEPSPSLRKQQKLVRSQMLRQMVMGKGKDWKWCELMGEPGQDSASERESAFFAAVLKAATQTDSARTSESVKSLVNNTLSASTSSRQPLMSSSSSGWQPHTHHQRQPQQPQQQQQVHPPVFGRSKSSSTPSLSATEEAENKDRDHASTSDLSRSEHPFAAVLESALSGGAEALSVGQDNNKNLEPESQPGSGHLAESKTDPPIVPSTSSMSVSVPNLSSAKDAVSTLADHLPSLRRHSRGSVGSSSSVLSNRSNTLQSTFVRFPTLASTLSDPGNNFLSSAQSAPNLPSAVTTTPPPSVTTNTTHQSTVATGTLSSALATSLTSTSSESDNEFLETCRASSLLAELEDEDFCGDPEDLDDENEDDSGDDYDEFTEEDEVESRGRGRKAWDDEHVLRRQFSALVPAFDPRPGKTNVQQTTDLEVTAPGTSETSMQEEADTSPAPKLSLYLKGPGLAGTSDSQILCDNMESTIFRYVQNLYQQSTSGVKQDRLRRIWEPTYVVIYGERKEDVTPTEDENVESPWTVSYVERHLGTERLPKSDVISMMQQYADIPFLRRWKLIGNARSVRKSRNCAKLVAAYKEFVHLGYARKSGDQSGAGRKEHSACTVDDVLQLLRVLHVIANDFREFEMKSDFDTPEFSVPTEEFYSKKINNKLAQQIQDPLVLSSLALPSWCEKLTHRCPMLFPFETRQLYFNCTAYGVSRAIVWLQGKREATTDRVRTPSTRREEQPEFQVGRLKHERVKVPRGEQLLEWGVRVMELHSRRKSILEVEFLGEEGTGLGPTLEFYALVAAELQKKLLGMWLCEDDFQEDFAREVPESSSKETSFPWISLYLEDIPELISDLSLEPSESKSDTYAEDPPKLRSRGWFYGILTWEDLELIDPHRAHFLRQLQDLVDRKKMILKDKRLTEEDKQNEIQNLALDNPSGLPIRLEDLSLTFCYNPPSSVYGYTTHNLKPNGSEIPVTIENAEEYIKQVTDFCLHSGIKKQMEAFKGGFNEVFPMDKLQSFSSGELQTLMCGDQAPNWTREDILNYTEPKLGYTRERLDASNLFCSLSSHSPGFQKFVNVLCSLNGDERKSFLQFTTGCSSLPPGGASLISILDLP
ncbi:putative E3 ubiquitin-protein ligase HECTD1 isoform X1 [Apostichopus japonicus]|uniref:E3 ubiquitin-protein ligase n=1 Tax=Stichopus japonicus TaxID=307972 RepID=A0A2G8LIF5_STIJA|nr:putative E3 ubiquitin-protein ligase HECTD1 isoform X1 [Apostichopus japonicus]